MTIIYDALWWVLEVYQWLIIATVIITWLPRLGFHIDRYHPAIQFLYRVTEPLLAPLRPISRFGGVDLSPLIGYFAVELIQSLITGQKTLANIIALSIVLIIAFAVHEFAHAYMANYLGDPTAKHQGRLTLDPRKHLDPLGTVMVLTVGFGWAKPVPVNPYNLRNGAKTGMAVVAAVGPLSNLVLAIIGAIPLRLGVIESYYHSTFFPNPEQLFFIFVFLNMALFFFNLLPIAPLDGFKVVAGLLPYPTSQSFLKSEQFGPVILLLLVFMGGRFFTFLILGPAEFVTRLLIGG